MIQLPPRECKIVLNVDAKGRYRLLAAKRGRLLRKK